MKKTLLALAVLGAFAGAAHAQSSVSISGNIDAGYVSKDHDTDGKSAGIDNDGSSTSAIIISGTEDLGGGLKAGFFLKTNLDIGGGTSEWLSSMNYISLGGNFGTFRLGKIDAQVMAAAITASPFGTATGSGYSADFSRLNGVNVSGGISAGDASAAGAGARPIRTSNSLYYTSPNFSGFEVNAGVSFENDEATSTAGAQEIALSYKANGLNAMLAYYKTTVGDTLVAPLAPDSEVEQLMLGANYTFGPATIYAGYSQSDSNAEAGNIDANSYNIAGKYMITPAVAIMANYVKVSDDTAAEADRDLFGLGLDYSLSKRTTAYVRYEKADLNDNADDQEYDKYAIGLRHAF